MTVVFLIGVFIGNVLGVALMCLMQVNRYDKMENQSNEKTDS